MRYITMSLAAMLCIINSYAQSTSKDSAQHIVLDTLTVSVPAGAPAYQASTPLTCAITHTRVALTFDMAEKTADVREWIKLHPYFFPTDSLVLDAKGVHVDSMILKNSTVPLTFTYKNEQLFIHFGKQYTAKDSIELYLHYKAMPYAEATGGSGAITDDRGLYFINTNHKIPNKPSMIWTQGETEANSHWMITIDKPNTRFTTQIELTVPDSFVTLSNGAMIKQIKGVKGLRTDIWRMDMPIQAYAVMFAAGNFSIVKDKWKNKEVNYYVEPAYAPYAKLMFNHTPDMIEYFSQRTGVAYPWNKYSQVVVRDYVSGAMENTTASLFGEFMNQNAREISDKNSEDVVSHELFHQWFGDYVTCESWSNLTVNESFANYGEQLWRTHKYGKASGDELAYNDLQIYLSTSLVRDPQLVRFNYDNREEMFDPITYNKGGAILHYLNNLMGDAAFDQAMKIYLTRNALHSAEAHNWRMAIEEATGQDWNWFFNEWYYHAGHPVLKVAYNYNDSGNQLEVTVNQAQKDSTFNYTLPLKAAVIYGSSKTIMDWDLTRRKETFVYPYKNGVKPVIIPDYAHVLPGDIKEGKKQEQWLVQFMQSEDFISKRLALAAAGRLLSDSSSQVITDLALNDNMPSIRKIALAQLSNTSNEKYKKRWTAKVSNMAMSDSNKLVRAEAYSVLGNWKVTAAKPDMIRALGDSSYAIAGAALEAINKIDKDTAYILARRMTNTDARSTLDNNIWGIIGRKGADEDIALIEQHAQHLLGNKKFYFAFSLGGYLEKVKSDASFKRGMDVLTAMVINEEMKNYRSTLAGTLFQVAASEKGDAKSENKEEAEKAQKRSVIVKAAAEKIITAETDPETKKDMERMMRDNFE